MRQTCNIFGRDDRPLLRLSTAVMLSLSINTRCPKFAVLRHKCFTAHTRERTSSTGMASECVHASELTVTHSPP